MIEYCYLLYSFFETTVSTAVTEVPDAAFIVNLGDLVNDGYNEQQWKWHFSAIKGVAETIPYMGVVGNHDAYNPTEKSLDSDKMWDAVENFSLHFNHPDTGRKLCFDNRTFYRLVDKVRGIFKKYSVKINVICE